MTMSFVMREPCRTCGTSDGHITERGKQDVVRCARCNRYAYCAPRIETGKKKRTLSTREGITPSQRARILATHDHSCISCGKRPPEVRLELDHIISRELAAEHGCLDELIDSEHNLAPRCEECNSGNRWLPAPSVRLMYRTLMMKQRVADQAAAQ